MTQTTLSIEHENTLGIVIVITLDEPLIRVNHKIFKAIKHCNHKEDGVSWKTLSALSSEQLSAI